MTSIQDLPIELLVYIFRLSFDITSLRQDRCRLSLVCHFWRDLLQEFAYLWTEISAHDGIQYLERSLAKSKVLSLNVYYLFDDGPRPRARLSSYINQVIRLLSRSRSISLIAQAYALDSFALLFVNLQSQPALRLESLILRGFSSQSRRVVAGDNPPGQLPETSAFPKLRRLEIEGIPCKLSSQGLQLRNVLSLNLVDVVNVSAEQLLDVLRNSPYLEGLELGRSPVTCPAHTALTPIHLPHLTTLHLMFMPIPVSNLVLSTIHAPNCSELFISSRFPELPDDVVSDFLFTSSTNHFTPVLRTLLHRGRKKDIDITNSGGGRMEFLLQFHDWDRGRPASRAIIRLDFKLNSARQIEETVHWLGDYLHRDLPEISVRLLMDGVEDVHILNLIDSYTTITHLGFRVPSSPRGPTMSNSIFVHMAQPTQSRWPFPNLEVFFYGAAEDGESHDAAMLDMLRRRYMTSSEGPDNERERPRPIRRSKITTLLGEVTPAQFMSSG
ncbi:hypothetical protein FRC04_010922 [Tulasnella sp. 424]|nr:hypothetical protein FRC04_010922 [Tulasnella sp. 424]